MSMLNPFVLFALASLLSASATAAPYKVRVPAGGIEVLSGPGDAYYAAAQLAAGEIVTVYRDEGRFLAIRPPQGSYSLVPATEIREVAEGVGVVLRDELPSRIGSRLSDQRDAVHVRLSRGERVKILGHTTVDGVNWVRIAPPSGEFRWIRAADLRAKEERVEESKEVEEVEEFPKVEEVAIPQPEAYAVEHEPLPLTEAPRFDPPAKATVEQIVEDPGTADNEPEPEAQPEPSRASVLAAEWAQASEASEATFPRKPIALATGETTPDPQVQAEAPVVGQTSNHGDSSFRQADGTDNSTRMGFSARMQALEVELARRVAQPASLWKFDDIEAAAAALYSLAETDAHRAAVRDLANRAARFEAIAARRQLLNTTPPQGVRLTRSRSVAPKQTPPLPGQPFTAQGVLRKVVSRSRPDSPPYALLGADGKVAAFVTPQPGLPVESLDGKQVVVTGAAGFMPALGHRHVAATRVAQVPPTVR